MTSTRKILSTPNLASPSMFLPPRSLVLSTRFKLWPTATSVFHGVDASVRRLVFYYLGGWCSHYPGGWRDNCLHISPTAETTSEEDSIKWLDFGTEDDAPVGGTITGTVVTPDGSPARAKIYAQTTDNLLLKHVVTKSDGSFSSTSSPRRMGHMRPASV